MGPGGRRGTGPVTRTTMAVGRDVGSSGGGRLKKHFERLRFRCYVTVGEREGLGAGTKSAKMLVTPDTFIG
jgi:hypothetical protein